MNLGIIGAENTHAAAIARLLNVEKKISGFRVSHIWGETEAFAHAAALAGQIPTIVTKPEHMIGQVDCIMIDHRHGKYHTPAAIPFIKAGIPVFIDKPLSTSFAEAKKFLAFCARNCVPVTTLSAMPCQDSFKEIRGKIKGLGKIRALSFNGPGDYKSKYGGIMFYGIHQANMMVELVGSAPASVRVSVCRNSCSAICAYPDTCIATITMIPGLESFYVTAMGDKGSFHCAVATDQNVFLGSARIFTTMFRTGKEPFTHERMLAPIALLDAMARSLKNKKWVKVPVVA